MLKIPKNVSGVVRLSPGKPDFIAKMATGQRRTYLALVRLATN